MPQRILPIGGLTVSPINTPTIQASTYSTGNVVGGLLTITSATRTSGGSGMVQSVILTSISPQPNATYDLFLFNANPTASTFADKTPFLINSADLTKLVGIAHITDITSTGTGTAGMALNFAAPFVLSTGTSLYGVLVLRTASATFTSVSDVSIRLQIIQD